MKFNRDSIRLIGKRAITAILSVTILVNVATPLMALGANVSYSNQLGTNAALGSPLLNSNFNYEDWNKWEMLAFGVFLSNFTHPLVDSYTTAFTVNNKGSAGEGKKALQFGSGSDSAGDKALSSMLNYAVTAQKSGYREIKAKYTYRSLSGTTEDRGRKDATIQDLLITSGTGAGASTKDGPKSGIGIEHNISGYSIIIPDSTLLCDLVVDGGSEGQDEVVFSWTNGWDIQMMTAWLSKVNESEYASKASDNLKRMIEEKSKLVLDNFGNICAVLDGEPIVLFPAAANCHIYKNNKYNLLNSVILSDNYTDASVDTLTKYVTSKSSENGDYLTADSTLEKGDVLVYFDSDFNIMKFAKDNANNLDSIKNANLNYGRELVKLSNASLINNTKSNETGFKVAIIGAEDPDGWTSLNDSELKKKITSMAKATKVLGNYYGISPEADVLTSIKTPNGDAPLFGSSAYVPVNLGTDKSNAGKDTAVRYMINDTFHYLDGTSAASSGKLGMDSAISYKNKLMQLNTIDEVSNFFWYKEGTSEGAEVSMFWRNSINTNGNKLYKWDKQYKSPIDILTQSGLTFDKLGEIKTTDGTSGSSLKNVDSTKTLKRISKIYTQTSNMKNAMNVLGVKEGTEFAVWTPYIYLTYLYWFGVVGGTDPVFNEHLFKSSSDLLNTKAEDLFKGTFLTKEEKEAEVLEYTYMMLHPTEGRNYRTSILMSWLSDWLYETYENIVYGDSVNSYTTDTKYGTRTASGFLHLDSYQDNFMTSWFMDGYGKYAIIIIGVILLAVFITGILNQKTLAWFIVSIILTVNIVLITPMAGEITPYVANNAVQSLFGNKMTYWAMAESISNSKLEKETSSIDSSLGTSDGLTTADYVRMLNIVYLDRSIMLRTDISKKVTEDSTGIMSDIQQLQSTRWLLPTLIRQFSASDGSANYVYQPLGDIYDNVSNMYWVYNPDDRNSVITRTSNVQSSAEPPAIDVASKKNRYEGYTETSMAVTKEHMQEESSDKQTGDNAYLGYTWNSVSRAKSDEQLPHTAFYMLDFMGSSGSLTIPDANGDWDALAENPGVDQDLFIEMANQLSQQASTYEPLKSGAEVNYGYLWTTENPMHYFYQTVKDTFTSGKSLSSLSADLQGVYKESSVTGEDERQSFMHFRDSGYVRDIADLEELFTNVIPYMYTVQIIAGGTDGTDGLLGDTKLTNYPLYEDNLKSWLFRCNWATKLMEDKDLTKPTTVRALDGTKVRIENPMLPSSYPDNRPMIFSEAQQNYYGLPDSELTLPELKAVKVNKAIERKWTLLINYLNTPDITTEVFYRQMATDALLEFNKEFSPDRLINGSKALYPTSLDLRSISFDSVMKMLMINSTRDASYIYGDTMKGVIETSDIFTAFLLLISAFMCSFLIPFIRNVVLGAIFYLGFWSVLCNILAGGMTKLKISAAYAVNNLVYLILTLAYYAVYALLINTNTADSVLSVGNININAGPPTWQFFIIIFTSLLYIRFSFKLLWFTIKNYKDLGFEVYATWGNMLANKISGGLEGIRSKLGFGGPATSGAAGGPVGGDARRSRKSDINANGTYGGSGSNSGDINVNINKDKPEENISYNDTMSGYTMDISGEYDDIDSTDNYYDNEIDKGRHMK